MSVSLHKTTEHIITSEAGLTLTGTAWLARCTCGWVGARWHHVTAADTDDEVSPTDLAVGEAESEGVDHMIHAQTAQAWADHQAERYR